MKRASQAVASRARYFFNFCLQFFSNLTLPLHTEDIEIEQSYRCLILFVNIMAVDRSHVQDVSRSTSSPEGTPSETQLSDELREQSTSEEDTGLSEGVSPSSSLRCVS